ncbi:thioester domain-containing protein [Plantibacter sp. CFBP 13570]|uniref:thioester domain-containing protein n=1 Tax=Plantibacter sp. CFBP 13570 TaxID=2775272 RepID=UPI001930D0F7|nr:thioester domain-containing protein [Plantibacter sp. CFBP 13570]MBD8535660.1 thioester domain-containing protein [Plantibacter sp. CFBP 13570]
MDQATAFTRPVRRRRVRFGALTLVTALALGGTAGIGLAVSPFSAITAQAATHGYGYDEGSGFIGQELINGIATYCLEILASPPTGDSAFVGNQAWASMSADDNARVNWAVSNYGQYADNNWAAATHLFVWSLADSVEYNSHGMSGDTYYGGRVPAEQRADVLAKLAQIRADATGVTAGAIGGGAGLIALNVDTTNSYKGTLEVSDLDPADATGTVTLTNGIFTDTGSATIAGVTNGMVLPVRGNPEDGVVDYKISGSATFSKSSGYAGQIGVYQSAGGAQQHTAGPGPKAEQSFTLSTGDPMDRSTLFQPVVTSEMQQPLVGVGGTITDHATCDVAADSASPVWRTNRDGSGVRVNWDVAFYPKADAENDLPEVPAGREPIGTATAACTGPGEVMKASIVKPAGITGQITAVWSMNLASQDAAVAPTLQADWHDGFGLATETVTAPRVTTKAVPAVYDGEQYGDTAVHTDVALYPDTAVQTFTAYKIVDGQNVCDASTVYQAESAPIVIGGRTEVPGPTFTASADMGEGVNWIERTYTDDTKTVLLSEGTCGEPDEQTLRKVKPAAAGLASTGFDGSGIGWIAGGLVALGLALMTGLAVQRRRKPAPIMETANTSDTE